MGKKGKISKRKLNTVPEGFRKASDVVDIQNNFLKAISGQTHTSNFKKEELGTIQEAIVNKEIERLRVLAKKFQNQEEVLFQKFSSKGITNYKKLNEKIQEWNESLGGNFLFENSFINKVVQIMKDEQNDDLEALVDQFINKKLDINVVLEVMGIEKIEDGLVDVIFSGGALFPKPGKNCLPDCRRHLQNGSFNARPCSGRSQRGRVHLEQRLCCL